MTIEELLRGGSNPLDMMDKYDQSVQLTRQAFALSQEGEFAEAIELYNTSFDVDPNAAALRGLGECYMALGQNREAIIYFAASTGLRPNPKVSFQLAQALLRGGHLDEAKRAAERAIALLPHYATARALVVEIEQMIALAREGDSPQPHSDHPVP